MNKTIRYLLNLPNRGTRNWEVPINENFTKIDQILSVNDDDKVAINQKIDDGDNLLDQKITDVDTRLNQIIVGSGDSNPEIVDARNSLENSTTYVTLDGRLEAIEVKSNIDSSNIQSNQSSISILNSSTTTMQNTVNNHLLDNNNPHGVTPAQINAPDLDMFNDLAVQVDAFKTDTITAMLYVDTVMQSNINGLSANIILADTKTEDDIKINSGRYDSVNKLIYIP